eukprot:1142863-Amphidinium_carterae.1
MQTSANAERTAGVHVFEVLNPIRASMITSKQSVADVRACHLSLATLKNSRKKHYASFLCKSQIL